MKKRKQYQKKLTQIQSLEKKLKVECIQLLQMLIMLQKKILDNFVKNLHTEQHVKYFLGKRLHIVLSFVLLIVAVFLELGVYFGLFGFCVVVADVMALQNVGLKNMIGKENFTCVKNVGKKLVKRPKVIQQMEIFD